MAIRSIVIFNIGPAFGGFRVAMRAGVFGLNNRETFEKLESGIDSIFDILKETPVDELQYTIISHFKRNDFRELMGDTRGHMNFSVDEETNGHIRLIVRACIPFRLYSSGGWTVFDGVTFKGDKISSRLSDEELSEYW